jgi:hypothetical protein
MQNKETLAHLYQTKQSEGFRIFIDELKIKFNELYREALDPNLSDAEVRRKLEQQRGVAYATNLMEKLISYYEGEIEIETTQGENDVTDSE